MKKFTVEEIAKDLRDRQSAEPDNLYCSIGNEKATGVDYYLHVTYGGELVNGVDMADETFKSWVNWNTFCEEAGVDPNDGEIGLGDICVRFEEANETFKEVVEDLTRQANAWLAEQDEDDE